LTIQISNPTGKDNPLEGNIYPNRFDPETAYNNFRIPKTDGLGRALDAYFADRSTQRGWWAAFGAGDPQPYGDTPTFLSLAPDGSTIYLEQPFENHDYDMRTWMIAECERRDIQLRCLSPRQVGRLKKSVESLANDPDHPFEMPYAEDDANAVACIRWNVIRGCPIARPKPGKPLADWRTDPQGWFMRFRTAGNLDWKNPKVAEIVEGILPHFNDLWEMDAEVAYFLGDPAPLKTRGGHPYRGYAAPTIPVGCIIAARAVLDRGCGECPGGCRNNRVCFDRLMGHYEHGYPSIFRSNITRRIESMIRRDGYSLKAFMTWDERDPRKASMKHWRRVARRATRLIFKLVKDSQEGNSEPVKGPRTTPRPPSPA